MLPLLMVHGLQYNINRVHVSRNVDVLESVSKLISTRIPDIYRKSSDLLKVHRPLKTAFLRV